MHAFLRTFGIAAWIGCILILVYQAASWVLHAAWPSLTLLDTAYEILGLDLASLIKSLPLEFAVKASYILITTELSIALWWTGIFFFGLAFTSKVVFGK